MTPEQLRAPGKPWPDNWVALDPEQAMDVLATGNHKAARVERKLPLDIVLLSLIEKGQVAAAYRPDGELMFQPTRLAHMQRYN